MDYEITQLASIEDKGVLFDLGHDFRITVRQAGQPVSVTIPLDRERLRVVDASSLYLARLVDEAGSLEIVAHLVPTSPDAATATVKASGTYTVVGLPRRAGDRTALRHLCEFDGLAARQAGGSFERICLVIDCPGDFESPSLCDRCFRTGMSRPLAECAVPQIPPTEPLPPGAPCPVAPANGESTAAALSADGRLVVFSSGASNLVASDNNHNSDVFLRDRQSCRTELISRNSAGQIGNGRSWLRGGRVISADRRFVIFESDASNMAPGATGANTQVYVRDRELGTTELVSVGASGIPGNGDSRTAPRASISADGRYVSFVSAATNLVPGDTNGIVDVFVHDRTTGTTERISVGTGDVEAEATTAPNAGGGMSADGRYVVFDSHSDNLVPGDTLGYGVFLRDRRDRTTSLVSGTRSDALVSTSNGGAISDNGNRIAFVSSDPSLLPPDTNGQADVLVLDRSSGERWRATAARNGDPALGGVGSRRSGTDHDLSRNGRFVTFGSSAPSLDSDGVRGAPGVRQVYRRDLLAGRTEMVSTDARGAPGSQDSLRPRISADGSSVVFASFDNGLVPADANLGVDIFVKDLKTGAIELISVGLTEP